MARAAMNTSRGHRPLVRLIAALIVVAHASTISASSCCCCLGAAMTAGCVPAESGAAHTVSASGPAEGGHAHHHTAAPRENAGSPAGATVHQHEHDQHDHDQHVRHQHDQAPASATASGHVHPQAGTTSDAATATHSVSAHRAVAPSAVAQVSVAQVSVAQMPAQPAAAHGHDHTDGGSPPPGCCMSNPSAPGHEHGTSPLVSSLPPLAAAVVRPAIGELPASAAADQVVSWTAPVLTPPPRA